MSSAAPLYPPKVTSSSRPADALVQKTPNTASEPASTSVAASAPKPESPTPIESLPTSSSQSAPATPTARPIMSAKDAINAMYATEKNRQNPKLIPSAREAVNAASRLAPKSFKSAANLHHGSLQKVQKIPSTPKNLESTRTSTSASALLKTAHSDSQKVPVVHTSLKLGANALPKEDPVILPVGARMARVARPVTNVSDANNSAVMINRGKTPIRPNSRALSNGLPVKVIPSNRPKLSANPRPRRMIRDPQMLNGGRRILSPRTSGEVPMLTATLEAKPNAVPLPTISPNTDKYYYASSRAELMTANGLTRPAQELPKTGEAPVRRLVRPRRFRTAPKNYAEAEPSAVSTGNGYAMSEPPKLGARRRNADADDFGVIKNFHPTKLPEPLGDVAPIGRLAGQRVASGHGGPAVPESIIKAENTSNYSFSRREDKAAKSAPYNSAEKSPFLKSVVVEKRPLSDSSVPAPISLPRTPEETPEKTSRKNSYQNRPISPMAEQLPSRPTVIVPSSRRSKAPLFFLILFTIILGAAVGAAVYLCFFQ